jgi:hypothetical protein
MVERGIGVCLRIILSVLSIAIVNPPSNNRIETDLDSWGTTIPVTPAHCTIKWIIQSYTCRPIVTVDHSFTYQSSFSGTISWKGTRLTWLNRMRLLNVRYFGRTYRKSSKSNGQHGSNLTEGCWIVSVAALNATPICRTARSMKHGLKMAPVVAWRTHARGFL